MTDAEALEWALALKSGNYNQDNETGYLSTKNVQPTEPVCYCCLGVEQVVHNVVCEKDSYLEDYATSRRGLVVYRLPQELQTQFVTWNDNDLLSFEQIGDKIIEGFNLTT